MAAMPDTSRDRRADPSTLTLMTLNAEFLWDGVAPEEGSARMRFPWRSNPVEAERHMRRIAEIVVASDPDVLVLCEVENRAALATFVDRCLPGLGYRAHVFDGDDVDTGQDVGLLTRIDADDVSFCDEVGTMDGVRKGLSKNIVAKLRVGPLRVGLVGVHLIAKPDAADRRSAREAQAVAVSDLARRLKRSGHLPIVCGDFNDYDGCDDSLDCEDNVPISRVLAIAKRMDPRRPQDDLVNVARHIPKVARYTSHGDRDGDGRVSPRDRLSAIDHVLVAPELAALVERVDIPKHAQTRGATAHFPVVVRFRTAIA
jgi:exonuclease III